MTSSHTLLNNYQQELTISGQRISLHDLEFTSNLHKMASCIVCNQVHVSERRSLDDVIDHDHTLRLRLEKVLGESVIVKGWMCFSCQFDLRQIETYYSLLNVFKQRYKNTAQQWNQQVEFKVEDSTNNSLLLDKTGFQSTSLLKLGTSDTDQNKQQVTVSNNEATQVDGSEDEDESFDTNVVLDVKDEQYNPQPNETPCTFRRHSKYKKRPKVFGSFECPTCNKVFKRMMGLNIHRRVHNKNRADLHNIDIEDPVDSLVEVTEINEFGKGFTGFDGIEEREVQKPEPSVLKRNKKHTAYVKKYPKVKDGSYECPSCNKIFRKPRGLDTHMRLHKIKKPKLPSWNSAGLAEQTQSTTKVAKSYETCEISSKVLRKQSNPVTLSLKPEPTEQKSVPFQCNHCKMTFLGTFGLNQHMKWHARQHNFEQSTEELETEHSDDFENEVFKCTICDKHFKTHSAYLTHTRWHTNEDDIKDGDVMTEPLFCSVCDLTFYKQSALNVHFKMHTTEDKRDEKNKSEDSDYEPKTESCTPKKKKRSKVDDLDYDPQNPNLTKIPVRKKKELKSKKEKRQELPCTHCDKTFLTKGYLRRHIATHTGGWPLVCNVCYKGFRTQSKLKIHMVKHSDSKPYICDKCGKRYKRSEQLRLHMRFHTEETLPCIVCHRKFVWQSALDIHMKTHTAHTLLPCSSCSRTFTSEASLADHIAFHTGEQKIGNKYPCWKCGKTFSKERIKYHMVTHTGEKKHACSICNKTFYTKKAVTMHMRAHSTAKPYKCDQCDQSYKTNGNLTIHKRGHTNYRPYKCSVCDKAFRAHNHVQRHMLCHTSGALSCNICWRTFKRKMNMETHMRIHSDARPYPCTVCKLTFRQIKTLKRHLRKHAENPDQVPRTRMINPSNAYNRAREHVHSEVVAQSAQSELQDALSLGLQMPSHNIKPNQDAQDSPNQGRLEAQDKPMMPVPSMPGQIPHHDPDGLTVLPTSSLYADVLPSTSHSSTAYAQNKPKNNS